LLNLLSNAIKYNRRGGAVQVGVDLQPGSAGAALRISVADTGRGLDAAQLRQLFEPFNRLGAQSIDVPGSGIGLAISRALVERMGGRIEVESTPGLGSVFRVALPAVALPAADVHVGAEAPAPAPAPRPPAAPTGPRRRVLYIEDNPVNAMIVRELLERRSDLELQVAVDGLGGVEHARRWQPDLLLLDMQLPDIGGLEVMRRLREHPETAALRCVALSANAMPNDIERALRAGAVEYWTKPLDFAAFLVALDRLLAPARR
jgi:CheY-like chemotaxis protein